MSGITAGKARRTSPLMAVAVHCLVGLLPRATGDDRKPVRLLPRRRLTTTIFPIVGRATGATCGGDDLGGSVVSQGFGEGHGQTIHRKNKSAMPKIILAIRRHCRHITHMSNAQYTADQVTEIRSQIKRGSSGEYSSIIENAPAWWVIKYRFAWLKISKASPERDRKIYAKWIAEIN